MKTKILYVATLVIAIILSISYCTSNTVKSTQVIDSNTDVVTTTNEIKATRDTVLPTSSKQETKPATKNSGNIVTLQEQQKQDQSSYENDTYSEEQQDEDRKAEKPRNFKVIGTKAVTLPANEQNPNGKKIQLHEVELSDGFKEKLKNNLKKHNSTEYSIEYNENDHESNTYNQDWWPRASSTAHTLAHDIGMNNVPVLDQGQYGTCTTFAATAIIDAKMEAGDYISQQCLLELGNSYEKNRIGDSGWEGMTSASVVYKRIQKHGVVAKTTCPHYYASPYLTMHSDTYESYSNKEWANIVKYKTLREGDLNAVKKAIDNNHRVSTAILLHEDKLDGNAVFNRSSGLWKLPNNLTSFYTDLIYKNKGCWHEIIITGYDDNEKLLKIRNSWGSSYGDHGEFYMDYEYYKELTETSYEVI